MRLWATVAAAALLAGCGGGDKQEAASTPKAKQTPTATATATATDTATPASGGDTISAASWSSKVTAICKQSEEQAKADGEQIGRKAQQNGDSQEELTGKLMAYISKELPKIQDKIDALPKPQGKEQQADRFSTEMRKTASVAGDAAEAVKENDATKGKQAVTQMLASVKASRRLAVALDIGSCNPQAGASFG
jgi:hypothetical protein